MNRSNKLEKSEFGIRRFKGASGMNYTSAIYRLEDYQPSKTEVFLVMKCRKYRRGIMDLSILYARNPCKEFEASWDQWRQEWMMEGDIYFAVLHGVTDPQQQAAVIRDLIRRYAPPYNHVQPEH